LLFSAFAAKCKKTQVLATIASVKRASVV